MKKLLIITHYFPPRTGIGSVRLGGLVKYLSELGWSPIVLTPTLPGKLSGNYKLVETPASEDIFTKWKKRLGVNPQKGFKKQIGSTTNIDSYTSKIVNRSIEFCKGILAYPDEFRPWYNVACKAATKEILNEHVDVMLSSSSPVTTHLIANTIKKKYGVPWVADLRDLWTQNHYYTYGRMRKTIEKRLELKTLGTTDAMITVSEPLVQKLRFLHEHRQIYCVPNGFDPDDHKKLPLTKDFTITYTGLLYEGKRDPRLVLNIVRNLLDDRLFDASNVHIRFLGPTAPWLKKHVSELRMEEIVSFDCVDRASSIMKQAESQLLLLLNWDDPGEKGVYTGKVFEYLGAKRPILSIGGGEGVVSELLAATNAGISCGSNSKRIKSALLMFYREYTQKGRIAFKGNMKIINQYSHREMARQFSRVLLSVL